MLVLISGARIFSRIGRMRRLNEVQTRQEQRMGMPGYPPQSGYDSPPQPGPCGANYPGTQVPPQPSQTPTYTEPSQEYPPSQPPHYQG